MHQDKQQSSYFKKNYFALIAKHAAFTLGSSSAFFTSICMVIIWIMSGPFFNFSETWQLIINTTTTIITFLMIFLLQNTQNRDTEILNLKLDELIKSHKSANNFFTNLDNLSDEELLALKNKYKKICNKETGS